MSNGEKKMKGAAFKAALLRSNYKAAELSRAVEVESPQTVNNWMSRGVPASKAFKVARLLGCSPQEISSIEGVSATNEEKVNRKRVEAEREVLSIIHSLKTEGELEFILAQIRSTVSLLEKKPAS